MAGEDDERVDLSGNARDAVAKLADAVEHLEDYDERALGEEIYAIAAACSIDPPEFFKAVYQVLIAKERGPKLAGFIKTCGKGKILPILRRYC